MHQQMYCFVVACGLSVRPSVCPRLCCYFVGWRVSDTLSSKGTPTNCMLGYR